jgi:hypothetical protein
VAEGAEGGVVVRINEEGGGGEELDELVVVALVAKSSAVSPSLCCTVREQPRATRYFAISS